MKYKITPFNLLVVALFIVAIYDYLTIPHGDGLAGTTLFMVMAAGLVLLVIDLAIQKFVKTYKRAFIIELIFVIFILFWALNGVRF